MTTSDGKKRWWFSRRFKLTARGTGFARLSTGNGSTTCSLGATWLECVSRSCSRPPGKKAAREFACKNRSGRTSGRVDASSPRRRFLYRLMSLGKRENDDSPAVHGSMPHGSSASVGTENRNYLIVTPRGARLATRDSRHVVPINFIGTVPPRRRLRRPFNANPFFFFLLLFTPRVVARPTTALFEDVREMIC